jgi:hypothetical protein
VKNLINGTIKQKGLLLPVIPEIYEPILEELENEFGIRYLFDEISCSEDEEELFFSRLFKNLSVEECRFLEKLEKNTNKIEKKKDKLILVSDSVSKTVYEREDELRGGLVDLAKHAQNLRDLEVSDNDIHHMVETNPLKLINSQL